MPERPKRRKNKNKRKNNKNIHSDLNQNHIDANKTLANESCSNITVNENDTEHIEDEEKTGSSSLDVVLETGSSEKLTKSNCTEESNKGEDSIDSPAYIVEIPEQTMKAKPKLDNSMKSKSCDNDDSPTIVEIIEDVGNVSDNKDSVPLVESNNIIVTEEETQIKWENVEDFKLPQTDFIEGVLSSMTIPLNIAHCEQTKTLSPEEESSLRNYLQTLNLSTNSGNLNVGDIKTEIEQIINREVKYRLRRKGFVEDNIYPHPGPSRSLTVIDEESGESSKTSRRQSYLSDKKSDTEELEDEVFESKQMQTVNDEGLNNGNKTSSQHLIPQKCIRVDAKLKEPEISEARGDWTMETVEKLTGAELVYLTDSSSSTSSVYEANEDIDLGEDTDVSVRMITPTIEITDTETLLSNTFLAKNDIESESQKSDMNIPESVINEQISTRDTAENESAKKTLPDANLILSENPHEIVILSTENLKTNLIVKDLNDKSLQSYNDSNDIMIEQGLIKPSNKPSNEIDEYDLEIKVLKCELNDAINNLIKEVTSDSESSSETIKDSLKRQDSSSSMDSSQCTAKYNPTHSSLNDVSNVIQDSDYKETDSTENNVGGSHVKEVLQCISKKTHFNENDKLPFTLRDICLRKITMLPFGDKILEELANVSQRLQNSVLSSQYQQVKKQDIGSNNIAIEGKDTKHFKENNQNPPPINPRKSSLKKSQDEQCKPNLPSRPETVYECLSPSQKMLMEKTNTTIEKEDIAQKNDTFYNKSEPKFNNQNKLNIAPLKSETGSRLLAFLRDTSYSPKINSSSKNAGTNENQFQKTRLIMESNSKRMLDEIDSTEIPFSNKKLHSLSFQNTKPSLPPKPNNVSSYFYESDSGIKENSFPRSSFSNRNNVSSYSYESDSGIRENSFHTLRSSKKYFHFSTGNLSKEIESDISSIQNMHRYCTNLRDSKNDELIPRRPSLPKDLCEQQMEYIRQKEKEVDAEIYRLEKEKNKTIRSRCPRAPMVSDSITDNRTYNLSNTNYVKKNSALIYPTTTNVEKRKMSSLFSSSEEELLREKMYSEYVNQMAEREKRKQHKVIKVTQTPISGNTSRSMPALESYNSKINNRIEQEFISKAKERWFKLGIHDPETEDERENGNNIYREPKVTEHTIKVIESGEEKDVKKLPSHMQEFVKFTVNDKDDEKGSTGESEKSAHVVIFCAVVILVLTVSKFLLRLFRNQ